MEEIERRLLGALVELRKQKKKLNLLDFFRGEITDEHDQVFRRLQTDEYISVENHWCSLTEAGEAYAQTILG